MIKNKPRKAKTKSIISIIRQFPDNEAGIKYLESKLWKNGIFCPRCSKDNFSKRVKNKYYCNTCKKDFNVKTNTIMQGSKIGADKWIIAFYLFVTSRKGISSLQLSKELDITQKTAWYLSQKIRECCKNNNADDFLNGIIEADET